MSSTAPAWAPTAATLERFAREVANRIVMMDEGVVVEEAPPDAFFSNPSSERTKAFLSKIL